MSEGAPIGHTSEAWAGSYDFITCLISYAKCFTMSYRIKEIKMKDTITIRLPKNLQRELDLVAKRENTSKSGLIRDALARYIAIKHFQQLRKKVLPFAEMQGSLTDEDIFRTIS
jgi:predicted transcriptional regulator